MEIIMSVKMDAPDSIGICGGVMTYVGIDELGDHLWVYGIDDVESNIEILSDYHTVRAKYKDEIVYEDHNIRNSDDLFISIEYAIAKLENCYKEDGLFMKKEAKA